MRPSIGRIVHFVMPSGEHKPAIVTRTFDEKCINVSVFDDSTAEPVLVRTSVFRDDTHEPYTWHWPEREDETAKATAPRAYEPGEAVPA